MQELRDDTYRRITELMSSAIGLSFSDSKKPLVSSRLSSRIQRLGLNDFEDYYKLISGEQDGGELQMAVELLTSARRGGRGHRDPPDRQRRGRARPQRGRTARHVGLVDPRQRRGRADLRRQISLGDMAAAENPPAATRGKSPASGFPAPHTST